MERDGLGNPPVRKGRGGGKRGYWMGSAGGLGWLGGGGVIEGLIRSVPGEFSKRSASWERSGLSRWTGKGPRNVPCERGQHVQTPTPILQMPCCTCIIGSWRCFGRFEAGASGRGFVSCFYACQESSCLTGGYFQRMRSPCHYRRRLLHSSIMFMLVELKRSIRTLGMRQGVSGSPKKPHS